MEEEFLEQRSGKSYSAFLAKGTKRQHRTYIGQWKKFCKEQNTDMQIASRAEGIEFLLLLYEKGLGYSAINTARSMLLEILKRQHRIWQTPHSHKNVKIIFQNKPALPRYIATYDAVIILRFLQSLPPSRKEFLLKWFTLKTMTLIELLSGH